MVTEPQRRALLRVHRYGDPWPRPLPGTRDARAGAAATIDAILRKGLVEEFAPSRWRLTDAGREVAMR